MRAKRFKLDCFFACAHESGDWNGHKQCNLRDGLRNSNMAYVADLAMLFVRGMPMPVPSRLHGKQAHEKN
jgi:hypothetical protein